MLNLMVDWHMLNENIQLYQVKQNHIPNENDHDLSLLNQAHSNFKSNK